MEKIEADSERADAGAPEKTGTEKETYVKLQFQAAPTYQPLGDDKHVPLFQSEKLGRSSAEFGASFEHQSSFANLQTQPGWDSGAHPFTLHAHSATAKPAMAAEGASALPHQFTEAMEYRLRKMELLVERISDVQRTQVLAEYHRSHSGADKKGKKEDSSESSGDSESECGVWTEGDGRDLWRATKEKKKRNPFNHSSYTHKGEAVDSFEKLMVVTFKTMEELMSLGKDVKGLVRHGLALSEKASTGIYKVDAFVKYNESVRDRAGRQGPSTFGEVNQEDVMRHFCYDNAETHRVGKLSSKAPVAAKKRGEKICLKYNGENGCNFKSCTFKHSCIACEEPGHPRKECKALKKKDSK